jgi:hypothetical protein
MPSTQRFWQASSPKEDFNCCGGFITHNYESVPSAWHLTKILFPDGNAIKLSYDSTVIKRLFKPFQMLEASRDGSSHGVMHVLPGRYDDTVNSYNSQLITPLRPIKLFRISRIETANESASFIYSNRFDDMWYSAHKDSTPTTIFPKPLPNKLENILISNSNGIRQKIEFNTNYFLRPHSYNSFYFPLNPGHLNNQSLCSAKVFVANPTAAVLTLQSIKILDKANNNLPPILFQYVDQNPLASQLGTDGYIKHSLFHFDDDCDSFYPRDKYWYLENRDVWGYYCPNSTDMNNFNEKGKKDRACIGGTETPYAAAWTLEKIIFPSGMSIKWEYESNKYDRCNGVSVSSDSLGAPRYGGGIRVKRVISDDGLGKEKSQSILSYFYTSITGDFDESSGSYSGHTTCEPYCAIANEYRTDQRTFGGGYIHRLKLLMKKYN